MRWALLQYDLHPYKKNKLGYKQVQREDNMETQKEDGYLQAKERGSEEINLAVTLISVSWSQNCEYFVVAALAN